MLVREIISKQIKPLRASDTAADALSEILGSNQKTLPVVDHTTNRFIGMVTRESAEKHCGTVDSVMKIRDDKAITASPGQNVFDTARMMDKHDVSVIPVLDDDRNYLGVVERHILFDRIIRMMNFTEYGSLITIHFKERDFTLSQLVRIIEAEGGLILGMSVESPKSNHPFYVVSIKLNLPDPGRIVAALRRHEFIVDTHSLEDQEEQRYEERADELLRYLNI